MRNKRIFKESDNNIGAVRTEAGCPSWNNFTRTACVILRAVRIVFFEVRNIRLFADTDPTGRGGMGCWLAIGYVSGRRFGHDGLFFNNLKIALVYSETTSTVRPPTCPLQETCAHIKNHERALTRRFANERSAERGKKSETPHESS